MEMGSILRVLSGPDSGVPFGGAFLIDRNKAITCAHVVLKALGISDNADAPEGTLYLDFPLLNGHPGIQAKVSIWYPPSDNARYGDVEDIAVLDIITPLPTNAKPAPLARCTPVEKTEVSLFGFPERQGDHQDATVKGPLTNGWLQLDTQQGQNGAVPGFSGSAVWHTTKVVGMVVARPNDGQSKCYIISTEILRQAINSREVMPRTNDLGGYDNVVIENYQKIFHLMATLKTFPQSASLLIFKYFCKIRRYTSLIVIVVMSLGVFGFFFGKTAEITREPFSQPNTSPPTRQPESRQSTSLRGKLVSFCNSETSENTPMSIPIGVICDITGTVSDDSIAAVCISAVNRRNDGRADTRYYQPRIINRLFSYREDRHFLSGGKYSISVYKLSGDEKCDELHDGRNFLYSQIITID